MKVKIQVVIENDQGQVEDVQQVACLRRGPLKPEELGLNLAEAKQILHGVQELMVASQVNDYMNGQRPCPHCGARRTQKGRHEILFRTLFGKLRLKSLRLHHCDCKPGQPQETFSPLAELLPNRTAVVLKNPVRACKSGPVTFRNVRSWAIHVEFLELPRFCALLADLVFGCC